MEQEPRNEGPFTKEEVLEMFRSGDRMEAQHMLDAWYQDRQRETDEQGSVGRIELTLDMLDIYEAAGETDATSLQLGETQMMINSDQTINEEQRERFAKRLLEFWSSLS